MLTRSNGGLTEGQNWLNFGAKIPKNSGKGLGKDLSGGCHLGTPGGKLGFNRWLKKRGFHRKLNSFPKTKEGKKPPQGKNYRGFP